MKGFYAISLLLFIISNMLCYSPSNGHPGGSCIDETNGYCVQYTGTSWDSEFGEIKSEDCQNKYPNGIFTELDCPISTALGSCIGTCNDVDYIHLYNDYSVDIFYYPPFTINMAQLSCGMTNGGDANGTNSGLLIIPCQ